MSHPYVTVEVRGDHRAVGRAVGEAAREQIAAAVDFYSGALRTLADLSFAEAELAVRPYIERARQVTPQIVAELEGTAEGSGTTLWQIAVLTCGEELTCVGDPAQHCTTLAICGDGQAVVGHNEDWYAGDVDANVLLRATLPDGTTFVSMTAAGYLPATGISSWGIAGGANTLFSDDVRVGVPNLVLRRWALEARTLEAVHERCCHPLRARGSNHLSADRDGRILNVETSGTAHADLRLSSSDGTVWYAHTNRYLAPELAAHEVSTSVNSVRRLDRARELLGELALPGADFVAVAGGVLRDHATAPDSICGHPDPHLPAEEREMTCASQVWDLIGGRMHVCAGPPCESEYAVVSV
ncbi:MAG: hypothetical protein FJ000_00930 [Actinobacteria bacterium]|nr:hypothetical protein [Actinomycetota bacterium]